MSWIHFRLKKAARIKLNRVLPFLKKQDKVLDIGSGNGALVYLLQEQGYSVVASDIKNKSKFSSIDIVETVGDNLPFFEKEFDAVLLITMLHHTKEPIEVIREAQRVGKKVIIIEDLYKNWVQKKLTFFMDSLVNMEFRNHPHTNKTDKEWKNIFNDLEMEIIYQKKYPFLLFFYQKLYVLKS